MAKTKVLILYTSVGGGIRSTGLNIAEQLSVSGQFDTRSEDVEQVEAGILVNIIRNSTQFLLNQIPGLWGFLYNSKIIISLTLPWRKFIASFKSKNVLQILREFQPAIVISTSVNASAIMAYLKSKNLYRGQFVIVFSDYHLQEFWVHKEADLYICNIAEQVEGLKKLGIPPDKMKLTGTIIAEKFFHPLSQDDARSELGVLKSMPLVLIGGAGRSRSSLKEVFLQLLRSPKSFQVVVLCGTNTELKEDLSKITAPSQHPVKILGFVNNMDMWMAASNVLVYKTGGPSMAEAVAKKLPMVLTDVRAGHEMANLEYLLKHGIVQYARIPREAVFMVEQILAGKTNINHQKNFETIIKPVGATSLVDAINVINPESGVLTVKNYQKD